MSAVNVLHVITVQKQKVVLIQALLISVYNKTKHSSFD